MLRSYIAGDLAAVQVIAQEFQLLCGLYGLDELQPALSMGQAIQLMG
jgi:hypothetical protein